jgi:hypothetical protein
LLLRGQSNKSEKKMRLFLLSIFLIVLTACLSNAADSNTPPSFNFQAYFEGEWDVQKSTVNYKTNEITHAETLGHYSVKKENATTNLVGRYFDNDTSSGEITNELDIFVEITSPAAGQFKTGKSEEDMNTLFSFEFITQPNNIAVSHGEWGGSSPAFYQFVVSSWDRFLITVHRPDKPGEATLYSGHKHAEVKEKTFFQKYSMVLMIGGFFIFQLFTARTQARQGGRTGLASAAATQGQGQGGRGTRPQVTHAQVEEIPEEPADDQKDKKKK